MSKPEISEAARRETIFPNVWNPMHNLGSLSFFLFWIVAFTGIYLFVFFRTSVDSAWQSVDSISNNHFIIGSVIRSLHRYASCLLAVSVTIHIIREFRQGRFTGARWFSWVSGVPLLWLLFIAAIGGYWLVWDERAQYIALAIATLFDVIPIIVEPLSFAFMSEAALSDRFFTLMIFLHVGVPLALLLGMFIHIKRIRDANVSPPSGLAVATLFSLIVVSLVKPATSMAPANLDLTIVSVEMDWFYLNLFPLIDLFGPQTVWIILGLVTVTLGVVPWLHIAPKPDIAVVDPEFCNGCGWCFADCPYDAIYMKPHEFRENHQQAVVVEDYCVGCGICAGACPSATPFKNFNQAYSGINLLNFNNMDMLAEMKTGVSELSSDQKILVVGCQHGPSLAAFSDDQVCVETLECIGQLPPSYLDYLCRREGVESVVLTGCKDSDCYHRKGIELQEERLVRLREPHLRYADALRKIETLWIGPGEEIQIAEKIAAIKAVRS